MLRLTGGMRGECFLVGLLQVFMSIPSPALAALNQLPTPGLGAELVRVRDAVTRDRQGQFKYGSLGGAELPLARGGRPSTWIAAEEREGQAYAKVTRGIRPLEVFKEEHKVESVYTRLAEARIEGLGQRPEIGRAHV